MYSSIHRNEQEFGPSGAHEKRAEVRFQSRQLFHLFMSDYEIRRLLKSRDGQPGPRPRAAPSPPLYQNIKVSRRLVHSLASTRSRGARW